MAVHNLLELLRLFKITLLWRIVGQRDSVLKATADEKMCWENWRGG
jgi:hypothetical protein